MYYKLGCRMLIRSILLLGALTGGFGKPGQSVDIYSGQHHVRFDISPWWYPEGKRPNVVSMHYVIMPEKSPIDLGASIIGTIVLILLFLFFRRWIRYSALSVNWKHIRSLGWRRIAKDTWAALFQDSLLLSSVLKRSKGRWIVHGLVLYGFIWALGVKFQE